VEHEIINLVLVKGLCNECMKFDPIDDGIFLFVGEALLLFVCLSSSRMPLDLVI